MPVYNGQKYVSEAVDSILNQSLTDFELIVIDDGSVDDTPSILKKYCDKRIRILTNSANMGVAKSLNLGIRESRGRYIARMDSDDIALAERLKIQVRFLETHPDISLIGASVSCFGESHATIRYWKTHEQIHANCLFNTPFAHPVVCWRNEDFKTHDLYYQEDPPTAEDFELWERACLYVKCANIRDVVLRYRIDPTIKMSQYLKQQYTGARDVRRRLLSSAGIQLNEEEEKILHAIGENSYQVSEDFFEKAENLFLKIWKEHQSGMFFDVNGLRSVLQRWRYGVLSRHFSNWSIWKRMVVLCAIHPIGFLLKHRIQLLLRTMIPFRNHHHQ